MESEALRINFQSITMFPGVPVPLSHPIRSRTVQNQSKLHTTVVLSSEDGVVVGFFADVVTGGSVPDTSKLVASNAGDRVGFGYGHSICPWTWNTTHEFVD